MSAFKFINADGVSRYGRYRILPVAGNEYLDAASAAAKAPDFLFDELKERIAKEPVKFRIVVQLANDGDTIDDATVRWPEDRPQLAFGEITLTAIALDNTGEQTAHHLRSHPESRWYRGLGRPTLRAARQRLSTIRQTTQDCRQVDDTSHPPGKLPALRRHLHLLALFDKRRDANLQPCLQLGHLGPAATRKIAPGRWLCLHHIQLNNIGSCNPMGLPLYLCS